MAETHFAPDIILHSPAQDAPMRGRETMKGFIRKLRIAFPDLQVTVEDTIVEGDRVVTRCTTRGTQRGDYFGTPPTNRQVTIASRSDSPVHPVADYGVDLILFGEV